MNTGTVPTEEIKKALDAATPGPWYAIRTEIFDDNGPIAKLWGEGWKGKFDFENYENNAHLIANAPTWLRSLLEENKMLKSEESWKAISEMAQRENQQLREELEQAQSQIRRYAEVGADKIDEVESLRSELAAVKEKEFIACSKHHEFIADIERLETELAAKDKVLREYAAVGAGTGAWARKILSQYATINESKESP